MASANLQSFLEDRLRALDPTIDLDVGSPAQVQFIEPVLTYLGTDPFTTDIDSFISDRFAQEFPNIFAGDPGVVRDTLIKPLILFLTPFQREIETIKRNQSLQDPTVLSDDDADALVANVFDQRDPGGYAVGVGRVFFTNPTNIQIEVTNRFFTADGLGFFPTNPQSITAEEMVFNRSGSQFYFDVPIKAEDTGASYNIDIGTLSGVDGVFGAISVTNLQKFDGGSERIDTPTLVASAREALNERSLTTRRGATARLNDQFQTSLRAVQVIGANDPEMERDILVALSPGHQWITGTVTIYKQLALVQARTIEGSESDAPSVGDTLYLYLSKTNFPSVPQASRLVRLTVDALIVGPIQTTAPFQTAYLVTWSGSFPTGTTYTDGQTSEGGFSKKGNIAISSIPDSGTVNFSVPTDSVHVFGHDDIYVRPILQAASTATLNGVADQKSLVERITLSTFGLSTEKNKVTDPGGGVYSSLDFVAAGVEIGDVLSIETGDDIGTYVINKVTTSTLYLNSNLTNTQTGIRYRIIKGIGIDIFEPKIPKFPFGDLLADDLQTVIGSTLFTLGTNDIIGFNAQIGDVIRVTSGVAAGDYVIKGFDSVLGGRGPIVDRPSPGTASGQLYEVFTALQPILRPLVRLKQLILLDSSNQSTGINIPYSEPVGVVPTCDFTSARVRASSQRLSGFTLPSFATTALTSYLLGPSAAAPSGDRRYSLGFDTPEGLYFPVQFPDTSYAELDYRADPAGGTGDALDPSSYFVAVTEVTNDTANYPPIDPKSGDVLTLKDGLNKGDYIIKDVVKFKHKLAGPKDVWTYFIKIEGSFPYDTFGMLFDFLNSIGGGASVVELPINGSVAYPTFFTNLYASLGTKLNSALVTLGVTSPPSAVELQAAIDSLVKTSYDWGDPARGTLRTFMMDPTLLQQNTGDGSNITTFTYTTSAGDVVKFRPDPNRYTKQELIPARLTSDADPTAYPRDLDVAIQLAYNTQTANFTIGKTVTGASSGAYGTIVADNDLGATGTLTVSNVVGAFSVGEIITDNNTVPGSATAGATSASQSITLTDTSRASPFIIGIDIGDFLSVHEEIFFHGTDNSRQTAVQTLAGSSQITAPASSGSIFTADLVGDLLFIDQGLDAGAYRVVKYIDANNIVLDKALVVSTPSILAEGNVTSWGNDGTNNQITSTGFDFTPYINKSITIYGLDYDYQGTYVINAAPALGTANITRTGNFPGAPTLHTESDAHFVITESPSTAPTTAGNGTELYGLRPIRMYQSETEDVKITAVTYTATNSATFTINTSPPIEVGLRQPYRIYRKNLRRVTPSEMELNTFGPLFYFDTDVVSYSPQSFANVSETSYLALNEGTYTSLGYKLVPDDRTLTYSMEETGTLDVSPRILPVGSTDSADNFITLLGASIQVDYEQSTLVQQVQEFVDSAEDRITVANCLVRHFLPAYISYDATYTGGSAPSIIAADIYSYLDTLPIETAADVSEVEKLIDNRGGNPTTPTTIQALIHDWSRRIWLEFSQDQIGGTTTNVPYDGTPRVSYYIPGPDESGQTNPPEGERIILTQT